MFFELARLYEVYLQTTITSSSESFLKVFLPLEVFFDEAFFVLNFVIGEFDDV